MRNCFKQIKWFIFMLSFLLITCIPTKTMAYSEGTHRAINEKNAEKGSYLHQYLINQLGFKDGVETEINNKWIIKHISDGGEYEDAGFRPPNHFHNPLTNDGLGFFHSAVTWATLPVGTQQMEDFSWYDVRNYYYKALTSTEKTTRDRYFALTFRGIGQLMHLVQDMSVPAHVRMDIHPPPFWNDDYEKWAEKAINDATQVGVYHGYSGYTPYDPSLFMIPQLFDTEQYLDGTDPGITLSHNIGLAEFTNANFLSADTIFKDFPYPDWSNLQEYEEEVPPGSGKWIVYNKKTGSGLDIEHFVREKIYYDKLPSQEAFRGLMLDDAVHKDYAQHLIPRAIGYSSQVLSYFFRGEINLITNPQNSGGYVVENKTEEEMEGTFALYYDDTNDERQLLWDGDFTIGTRSSGNNKSGNIDLTEPNDAKKPGKYILVFQGRLGNETDAVVLKAVTVIRQAIIAQSVDDFELLSGEIEMDNRFIFILTQIFL